MSRGSESSEGGSVTAVETMEKATGKRGEGVAVEANSGARNDGCGGYIFIKCLLQRRTTPYSYNHSWFGRSWALYFTTPVSFPCSLRALLAPSLNPAFLCSFLVRFKHFFPPLVVHVLGCAVLVKPRPHVLVLKNLGPLCAVLLMGQDERYALLTCPAGPPLPRRPLARKSPRQRERESFLERERKRKKKKKKPKNGRAQV